MSPFLPSYIVHDHMQNSIVRRNQLFRTLDRQPVLVSRTNESSTFDFSCDLLTLAKKKYADTNQSNCYCNLILEQIRCNVF